jgi:hypothetical protein
MLTDKQIQALLEFLKRVQLQGLEAPMFIECVTALNNLLDPAPSVASVGQTGGVTVGTVSGLASSRSRQRKPAAT